MFGVLRFKEKPSRRFWIASTFGSLLVLTYSFIDGTAGLQPDDIWLVLAIFFGALGYSEGGKLAEQMGAITVISWALALTLPLNAMITFYYFSPSTAEASLSAWIAFGYVGVFSMFIAFFFLYRGIALGGVARVGQVQVLQPFLTLLGAYFLLDEPLTWLNSGFAVTVLTCRCPRWDKKTQRQHA
jgi:drug/metabolite transporter (DMT)-like permease